MNYEKKYKDALERANEYHFDGAKQCIIDTLEYIFPELKESEDERIRKSIYIYLDWLDGRKDYAPRGEYTIRDMISWLEKQGGQTDKIVERAKTERQRVLVTESDGSANIDWDTRSLEDAITLLKHGLNYLQEIEVKKQIMPNSRFGGCSECIPTRFDKEKQGKKESNDKNEPKFKVGDQIKHNKANIICKIISVNSGSYYVENIETSGRIELFNAEQNFHLWTIQDAKDGDVLIDKSGSRECPFIFKKTKPSDIKTDMLNPLTVLGYCGIGGAGFTKGSGWGDTVNCIYYPATKEHRELLFKKMHEAGYMWDSESKQLLSLKAKPNDTQNPAWSEEDEEMLKMVIKSCEQCGNEYAHYWLKSLKPKPKQEWSEEDERILDALITSLNNEVFAGRLKTLKGIGVSLVIDWLKSIKTKSIL